MKSPLTVFFSLGDKVTGGDAYQKARFDYYLMWVIFLAFLYIGCTNVYHFYLTTQWSLLAWSAVMFAISWFQYSALTMSYKALEVMKGMKTPSKELDKIDDVESMLKEINR